MMTSVYSPSTETEKPLKCNFNIVITVHVLLVFLFVVWLVCSPGHNEEET